MDSKKTYGKIDQGLEGLVGTIGEMLSEIVNNNQKEWKNKDIKSGVWKNRIEGAETTVDNAHVRCTCCTEETSEVCVHQRESKGTLQGDTEQLNHKDTVFNETFKGCINTEGGKCEIRILDDIWFAPDESIEVGDGYALDKDTSYMICLTGYGMIYISDSGQAIESMDKYLVDELLNRLINHKAFMDMGWSSDFEVAYGDDIYDELKKYMKKYGIVNSVSIAMFLATMNEETGGGAKKLEKYEENDDYTANVRGAGLMQITGATQMEFLEYIKDLPEYSDLKADIQEYINHYSKNSEDVYDNKYINSDGKTAAEFIAEKFPVESATWLWAACPKIGNSSINDCVVEHAQDNRFNTFAVSQMAVNAKPFFDEVLERFFTCQNNCVIEPAKNCTEPGEHTGNTDYCITLEEDSGNNNGDTHRHNYGPNGWDVRLDAYKEAIKCINQPQTEPFKEGE